VAESPTPLLRTPRLLLRRWREDDVAALAAINADPEVMRWIGDGSVGGLERTRAFMNRVEKEWEATGLSIFAVQMVDTGELAGLAGMAVPHFLPEIMPAIEIAWRLGRSFWGRGIATEAALAALEFGLADMKLARIVAIVQVGNAASERVMHKLGMRLERQTTDPGSERPVRVYEITRDEWQRRSGGDLARH
jgi:RimJ/RimL family protein N-acetyltransferase